MAAHRELSDAADLPPTERTYRPGVWMSLPSARQRAASHREIMTKGHGLPRSFRRPYHARGGREFAAAQPFFFFAGALGGGAGIVKVAGGLGAGGFSAMARMRALRTAKPGLGAKPT